MCTCICQLCLCRCLKLPLSAAAAAAGSNNTQGEMINTHLLSIQFHNTAKISVCPTNNSGNLEQRAPHKHIWPEACAKGESALP